jgi:hypothetical protein
MFNTFRSRRQSSQAPLRELICLPSLYPEGTPGWQFFDRSPKENLLVVRGVREAAQRFRTELQGFGLAWENVDPAAFHNTFPLLLNVLRDNLDYEAYPVVELIEQATIVYADPKNAKLTIVEVLTLAMANLNGGKRHNSSDLLTNNAAE